MNQDRNAEFNIKPAPSKLRGVGGWLGFFIIGQLVLRPLRMMAEFTDPKNAVTPLFEAQFPTTATVIGIERAVNVALLVFGVVMALALWKVRTPISVKLAKIFLIANPILAALDAIAYRFTDLPTSVLDEIMVKAWVEVGVVTVICLLWFLYFTKSERVRATYYDEVASLRLR
jgi:hypothetical protein